MENTERMRALLESIDVSPAGSPLDDVIERYGLQRKGKNALQDFDFNQEIADAFKAIGYDLWYNAKKNQFDLISADKKAADEKEDEIRQSRKQAGFSATGKRRTTPNLKGGYHVTGIKKESVVDEAKEPADILNAIGKDNSKIIAKLEAKVKDLRGKAGMAGERRSSTGISGRGHGGKIASSAEAKYNAQAQELGTWIHLLKQAEQFDQMDPDQQYRFKVNATRLMNDWRATNWSEPLADVEAPEGYGVKLVSKKGFRQSESEMYPSVDAAVAAHNNKAIANSRISSEVYDGDQLVGTLSGPDAALEQSTETTMEHTERMRNLLNLLESCGEEQLPEAYRPLDVNKTSDAFKVQGSWDKDDRDFKRAEHNAEWEAEKQANQARRNADDGPWYINVNGKTLKTGGQPKVFDHIKPARAYIKAIKDKNPNAGNIIITRKPEEMSPMAFMKKHLETSGYVPGEPGSVAEYYRPGMFDHFYGEKGIKTLNLALNYYTALSKDPDTDPETQQKAAADADAVKKYLASREQKDGGQLDEISDELANRVGDARHSAVKSADRSDRDAMMGTFDKFSKNQRLNSKRNIRQQKAGIKGQDPRSAEYQRAEPGRKNFGDSAECHDEMLDETLAAGDKIKFRKNGKVMSGEVVRFDKGRNGESAAYVVYVPGYHESFFVLPDDIVHGQLDELSKDTLGSYVKKASRDASEWSNMRGETTPNSFANDPKTQHLRNKAKHFGDRAEKRHQGIDRATDRLMREEPVNELSRDTLKSYLRKTAEPTKSRPKGATQSSARYDELGNQASLVGDEGTANRMWAKADNRYHGRGMAKDRLMKEDALSKSHKAMIKECDQFFTKGIKKC